MGQSFHWQSTEGFGRRGNEAEVAVPAVLIEHRDAIVPEPAATTPMLPVWPGPHPTPPFAPRLLARLNSNTPARLHPRNGQMLDRRANLEARLRRGLIRARQFAIDEHDERLAKLLDDT